MTSTSRIAKNTLFLYFRQILIMLVSLYTVRVVLATLGAEDYGIYNVVAGVVVLFSFVNNAMASGTQRFLNYSLGEGDTEKTREVFSASLIIHAGIVVLFVIAAETVGLWFVSAKLNLPEYRRTAAAGAYQFAVITTVLNIIRVPYNAVIIAYEKMSFFAWLSIVEAVLKLAVAFLLTVSSADKLIVYSLLLAAVALAVTLVYKIYCSRKFASAHFVRTRDAHLMREMLSFSGWSLFGATANVATTQGTNIILNMFTNVTVNAAMGIANQVNAAVYSFVSNFQTAFNPQIVKSWAAGEREEFYILLQRASKFSFYLLFLIVLPLHLNCEFVLELWLNNVPEYSVSFVRLILIWSLLEALNGPLYTAVQATGRIKMYQTILGILNLLNLPLTIAAFFFKASPVWLLYIRIGLNVVGLGFRIYCCKKYTGMKSIEFILNSVARPVFVSVCSFLFVGAFGTLFSGMKYFFITCITGFIFSSVFILVFGMSRAEAAMILRKLHLKRS